MNLTHACIYHGSVVPAIIIRHRLKKSCKNELLPFSKVALNCSTAFSVGMPYVPSFIEINPACKSLLLPAEIPMDLASA